MMLSQEHSLKKLRRSLRDWRDEEYLAGYYGASWEEHLKAQYLSRVGHALRLDPPVAFSEKLQWLKLYWRDGRACQLADKYSMRGYLQRRGLAELLPPVESRWVSAAEADLDALPERCILKASHASGFNLIVEDRARLDPAEIRDLLDRILHIHYFAAKFEWVYEHAEPSILCERLFPREEGVYLDYKFYCFSGQVKMVHVLDVNDCETSLYEPTAHLLGKDGAPLDFAYGYDRAVHSLRLPDVFPEMVRIAEYVAEDFPHIRVDMYCHGGRPYIGECTFFTGAGYDLFDPMEKDETVGGWVHLPKRV